MNIWNLISALVLMSIGVLHAEGLPGTIEWSDGHTTSGNLSLTPGDQLKLALDNSTPVVFRLEDVREIRMNAEKEEMYQGWYYPDADKTIQEKTGEVYPIRYLATRIILRDGEEFRGHLYTTMLYCEGDENTDKILLRSKQSGSDGQKLTELIYPEVIRFSPELITSRSLCIDLSKSSLLGIKRIVVVSKSELRPLSAKETSKGSHIWIVSGGDPSKIIYIVECSDSIHIECPKECKPDWVKAINASLSVMKDYYNKRTIVGCMTSGDGDLYSFVRMERTMGGADPTGNPLPTHEKPWAVSVLKWKYDDKAKKVILLNRAELATGRASGHDDPLGVSKDPAMASAVTLDPSVTIESAQP